ncbi:MAG: LysM peptidoglycan-binding domain-containing protein [Eubacterium sp.]|nr:LysM peptidoglycan-binding domain-containing protein [Eubacterium sp.]MBQ8980861.1 LysM peptidoglycan-binding domain-containing protein [Eubacterium sp.]MBR1531582.1 LysM peptidoglycan-binding domain-containing protein [Eubacterium sp.]MBR2278153.1 LysM peptidoglycan-binding domain-containing protein [Eubacterium sp.]
MNTAKMGYKGMTFDVNPATIRTDFSKKVAVKTIPFGFGKSTEICRMPVKITGSGMFCGKNAGQNAHRLMQVFEKGGSSYLFLPKLAPIKAFFTDLTMRVGADSESIEYTFSFTEDCVEKQSRYPFGYTYAKQGENLYDIANRCNITADALFSANDFMDMFSVQEGDKVWLR